MAGTFKGECEECWNWTWIEWDTLWKAYLCNPCVFYLDEYAAGDWP